MTRTTLFRFTLLASVAAALAGCGGGGHSSTTATTTTPPPATTTKLEDNFGTMFGTDFRASANSEPVKPASGDVIALTLTAEPMALH